MFILFISLFVLGTFKDSATNWNSEKLINNIHNNRDLVEKLTSILSNSKIITNVLKSTGAPISVIVDKLLNGMKFINNGKV